MKIDEIKNKVVAQFEGKDPFGDPTSWDLIEKRIPENCWGLLVRPGNPGPLAPDSPIQAISLLNQMKKNAESNDKLSTKILYLNWVLVGATIIMAACTALSLFITNN